jgi:hypothetical protein
MKTVIDATLQTVAARYVEACQDICASYGVKLERDEAPPQDVVLGKGCLRSVLSLSGDAIRLTSVLTIEASLLVAAHAAWSPEGTPLDLEDWCREFSNQVGGRLKNKLLREGVELKMGLAALVPDAAATPDASAAAEVQRCAFASPKGWMRGELAMYVAPGFKVSAVPGVLEGDALLEGMFLMF